MINIDKEKFRKKISILLNDLSWNILELGSFRNIQLSSYFSDIFKTFSKQNLQPEFSSFILNMLGCFPNVLISFSIGLLCFLEISQRFMLRPSAIPSKQDWKISEVLFLPKKLSHFQWVLFFHILVSFQWSLVLRFSRKNYYRQSCLR